MSVERKDPSEQLQIGDTVVYLPEGIIAQVAGYLWSQHVGSGPRLVAYQLDCGIAVSRDQLRPYEAPERQAAGPRRPAERFKL
ncbi:hypothetical protein [Methylobacterium sp. Leaf118]|uniref:hypothetical protein n=1 Tax=Methylobacterium sp. Leaf118 TaxID=2876562 RepID=UPI001E604131|nr:hypothetical protein [Methylobacterium sp. Leaf118]